MTGKCSGGFALKVNQHGACTRCGARANERCRKEQPTVPLMPICLQRSGDKVLVCVQAPDGRWVTVIREAADGAFHHIVEPSGIMKAIGKP